jgi:hypothetical protein
LTAFAALKYDAALVLRTVLLEYARLPQATRKLVTNPEQSMPRWSSQ